MMSSHNPFFLTAMFVSLALVFPSAALGHKKHSADADGDGFVSAAEHEKMALKYFDRLDEDGDGAVSRDGFIDFKLNRKTHKKKGKRRHKKHGRKWNAAERRIWLGDIFDTFDADKNGTLVRAEVLAESRRRFAQGDADGDGQLSMEEHRDNRRAIRREYRVKKRQHLFRRADKDGDGQLSEEEFINR